MFPFPWSELVHGGFSWPMESPLSGVSVHSRKDSLEIRWIRSILSVQEFFPEKSWSTRPILVSTLNPKNRGWTLFLLKHTFNNYKVFTVKSKL